MLTFSPETARRLRSTDHAVIVVGGGGWLGQATLEMLDAALAGDMPDRVLVFGSHNRSLALRSGRTIPCRALEALDDLPARPSLVLHYAFLTRDRVGTMDPDDFVRRNESISDSVARYVERLDQGGVFLPSSGAVYRGDGIVDDDLAANPYGVLKARDERRFRGLAEDRLRILICRLFNLAGPFINKVGSYALSSILLDIARGGPINLRADRPVFRSYVHVHDIVDLAVGGLLSDLALPETAFDTAGEVVLEVGELAATAARVLGTPEVLVNRPALISEKKDWYVGDGRRMWELMRQLGISPAPIDVQIADTAAYLTSVRTDQ